MQWIVQSFIQGMLQTGWMELVAVLAGIASVWFSKKEHILVYPVGLVNTLFFVYISIKGHLYGEASVNVYYTIMSIYGWWLWIKKDAQQQPTLQIAYLKGNAQWQPFVFFGFFYVILLLLLTWAKQAFAPEAIPWADAFASATAYTGMWLMAKKKVESWWWWMATNVASIPLYFVKGYVFTSVQFVVLLVLAIAGCKSWHEKARSTSPKAE
jgi:nicotinamide mononucleotide transporter